MAVFIMGRLRVHLTGGIKNKEEPAGLIRLLLSRFNYLFMRTLRPIIANQTQGRGIKHYKILVSFYLFTLFTLVSN